MHINIAISANSRFLNSTYSRSIGSLVESGVPPKNIFIFLGNDNIDKVDISIIKNTHNISIISLTQNYFENNCFIGLLENNLNICDYWFIIHDTCIVGKAFYSKLLEYHYTEQECVALFGVGGCGSIGAYKYSTIKKYEKHFFKLKEIDNTNQNLVKDKCIEIEDHIFKHYLFKYYYSHHPIVKNEEYLPGILRRKETCEYLDLSKFKANFHGRQSKYIVSDLTQEKRDI